MQNRTLPVPSGVYNQSLDAQCRDEQLVTDFESHRLENCLTHTVRV